VSSPSPSEKVSLVTEEGRDVDEDHIEEVRDLFGVRLEIVLVAGEGRDADRLHAALYAAHQRGPLVGGEVECAAAAQQFEQRIEFREVPRIVTDVQCHAGIAHVSAELPRRRSGR
jgi:hypothetical protein